MFRTPYNYDRDLASLRSGLDCSSDPSRTQQHMKDETDINRLVALYARTGVVPGADLPAHEFVYDDVFDFQTALNSVVAAERSFSALPSVVRDRFSNDPARLFSFVRDPDNRDEAIKLGLIPKPIEAPDVVSAPPPSGSEGEGTGSGV